MVRAEIRTADYQSPNDTAGHGVCKYLEYVCSNTYVYNDVQYSRFVNLPLHILLFDLIKQMIRLQLC